MQVTIKDIAKEANVSRGTVDRALNDRGGVNPDVAARIKSIASDLGYKPNTIAKALATRSNPVRIGAVINSIGNPFFDKVLEGMNSAYESLSDYGINMEVRKIRGYDPDQQLKEIDRLRGNGIDGLIITPVSAVKVRDELNDMIKSGIQVVCCNLNIDDVAYQAYVGCDYFCSGQTAGAMIGTFRRRKGAKDRLSVSDMVFRTFERSKVLQRSPGRKERHFTPLDKALVRNKTRNAR